MYKDTRDVACFNCHSMHKEAEIAVLSRAEGFAQHPDQILSRLPRTSDDLLLRSVYDIGDGLVVKHKLTTRPVEALHAEFARQHTSVPVPKVFLVFCHRRLTYMVLEFAKGVPLNQCWSELAPDHKSVIITKVASYVRQLRTITPSPLHPGPLDRRAKCCGYWLTDYELEPFDSYEALIGLWNNLRD